MVSKAIPVQAEVSPDWQVMSNALGGGTIVTLGQVPRGPSFNYIRL